MSMFFCDSNKSNRHHHTQADYEIAHQKRETLICFWQAFNCMTSCVCDGFTFLILKTDKSSEASLRTCNVLIKHTHNPAHLMSSNSLHKRFHRRHERVMRWRRRRIAFDYGAVCLTNLTFHSKMQHVKKDDQGKVLHNVATVVFSKFMQNVDGKVLANPANLREDKSLCS